MDTDHPLIEAARKGLEGRRGEWPKLAREARVSYSWLCKFAVGGIRNPGVRNLQRVLDALDSPPTITELSA